MTPSMISQNPLNLRTRNAETLCDVRVRIRHDAAMSPSSQMRDCARVKLSIFPYLSNNIFGYLGHAVAFTGSRSALLGRIAHIVELSPNKKMVWSHTKGIITSMEDKSTRRYRSKSNNPLEATCDKIHFFRRAHSKKAISFIIGAGFPIPASFAFFIFCIKAFDRFLGYFHVSIVLRGAAQ